MTKCKVFHGTEEKTSGGLKKKDLVKKKGVIKSKKKIASAKKNKGLMSWVRSVQKARKELKIKGFVAVNGPTAQGKKLYKLAKKHHKKK